MQARPSTPPPSPTDKFSKSHPHRIPDPPLSNEDQSRRNPRYAAQASTTYLFENGGISRARGSGHVPEDSDDDGVAEASSLLNATILHVRPTPSPIFLPDPKDFSTPVQKFGWCAETPSQGSEYSDDLTNTILPDVCKSAVESMERISVFILHLKNNLFFNLKSCPISISKLKKRKLSCLR